MGLFSFVKDAGKRLFSDDDGGAAPKDGPTAEQKRARDEFLAVQRKRREERLEKEVHDLGLPVTGLKVDVDGDKARVSGEVQSQEEREKVILAVGNVAGIASVDENLRVRGQGEGGGAGEVTGVPGESTFYTVKKGDTLSAIAKAHYGNAGKYQRIFEANRPLLSDPDKIYPGQVLRIPR